MPRQGHFKIRASKINSGLYVLYFTFTVDAHDKILQAHRIYPHIMRLEIS